MREPDRRDGGRDHLEGSEAASRDVATGAEGPSPAGNNGVPVEDMPVQPVPLEDVAEEPIDLVAVQADNELIDALAAGLPLSEPGLDGYDDDDRFVAMLAAWKAEVDAEPIPELVDTETAVATIAAASRPPRRRARHLVPLAAAAALIVFAVTGVSLGAHNAHPGDPLFGVTQVLYREIAQSRQAAVEAEAGISAVNLSLARGETGKAAQQLTTIEQLVDKVKPEDGAAALAATQRFLSAKLQETPAGMPTDPQAPLKDGTPRPALPDIDGDAGPTTSVRPGTTTPGTSTTAPTTGPSTSPTVDPRILGVPPTTSSPAPPTGTPSPSPKPTTEGRPDPTTPTGQGEVPTSGSGSTTTAGSATAAGSSTTSPSNTTTTDQGVSSPV
ncbi:anti-sigma-D factor RsdA [Pseudonocardia asaccharolytica]|uniref:Anti-sigma-D factor RsdA sigma factor binding region domain-containing protein n=1 Tax=Pseudonocardia asaccharolytica DSM 44247 = NBRC 16224 TaxID=1123024 RepID=A0A511CUU7_9PSEU|nr:anti-sigma-D factor RsdA [Pseudonocardia asaccharolytica]GEL16227.1 hypothetical protein PA7_00640 [Pseudonocardia asaccharolytica DSM 44247 = NBRC 16224]